MVTSREPFRYAAAAGIGLAMTTAHPVGIVLAIAMPALVLAQATRRSTYVTALLYYASALWPICPGARNFFGPDVSALSALALWAVAAAALASPWALMWSRDRKQGIWRAPVALTLSVVPPLGIIGFASPLTAAGYLFPHTAWCGLLAFAVLSGALVAYWRRALIAVAVLTLAANVAGFNSPRRLSGWQGVNTTFGAIAHDGVNSIREFQAAQWIQQYALSTDAKVIVFPETVVPTWTAATDAFWQQTFAGLRASGKTILVGARLPISAPRRQALIYDFASDLTALHGHTRRSPMVSTRYRRELRSDFAYDNAVLIRGVETAISRQRIPVPIAMWNPLTATTARLNLFGPGVVRISGERVAILVCYEQLLIWPVLLSMREDPTVLVGIANNHWATGTPIPNFQLAALRGWSQLFGLPSVSATNQ